MVYGLAVIFAVDWGPGRPGRHGRQVDYADSQIMSGWKLLLLFFFSMCLDSDSELRMNRIYWIYWSFRGLPPKITVKICTNTVRALRCSPNPWHHSWVQFPWLQSATPPLEFFPGWSVSKLVVEWQNLDNEMTCFFSHEHLVPNHPSMKYENQEIERDLN